ncbi:hypothetical protein JCM30471_04380 [Desulfuromonas carbonis]|uniref:DUF948 domain-containing protein n=1 Tax=Desulfuromonas sp. DDH964 TaxID=1823759 RepID=UPI00078E2D5B|nr:DUF948 domain-containing protein [Desulfuromonas sp. DDH964]AMV71940.1 hypothetical protein DBW_1578 [Desulfuromonas sp. DDH964]
MSVQIDIFVLIITVVFLVIAAALVPLLLQLKRTASEADALLAELRRELIPTLREFREASERLNRASAQVEAGAGRAGTLLESLGEVGDSIHSVNSFFHRDMARYAGNAAGLWLGIRAASKVILKGLQEKGG